jgi:hypothetical protein
VEGGDDACEEAGGRHARIMTATRTRASLFSLTKDLLK